MAFAMADSILEVILVGPACNDNLILLNDLHSRLNPDAKEPEARYNKDLNCKEVLYAEAGWKVLIPTSWRNLIPSSLKSEQTVVVYTCNPKFQEDKSFSMKSKILSKCDMILDDYEQMFSKSWIRRLPVVVILGSQPRASFLGTFKGIEFSDKAEFLLLFENQLKIRSSKSIHFVSCDSTSKLNLKFEVLTALKKFELNKFYLDDPYLSLCPSPEEDPFVETLASNTESGSSSEFDLVPKSSGDAGMRPSSSKSIASSSVLPIPEFPALTAGIQVRPLRSTSLPSEPSDSDSGMASGKPKRSSSFVDEQEVKIVPHSTVTISLTPFDEKSLKVEDFRNNALVYSQSDEASSDASSPGGVSEALTGSITLDPKDVSIKQRSESESLIPITEDVTPEEFEKDPKCEREDARTLVEEGSIVLVQEDVDTSIGVERGEGTIADDCSIALSTSPEDRFKVDSLLDNEKSVQNSISPESKLETTRLPAEEDFSTMDEVASVAVSCAFTEQTRKVESKSLAEDALGSSQIFRRRRSIDFDTKADAVALEIAGDKNADEGLESVSVSDDSVQTFEVEDSGGAVASVKYVDSSPAQKMSRRSGKGSPQSVGCTPPRRFSLDAKAGLVVSQAVASLEFLKEFGTLRSGKSGDALTDVSF